jgi:hypothetical protein
MPESRLGDPTLRPCELLRRRATWDLSSADVNCFEGAPGTGAGEGVVGSVRDIFGAWKGVTF